LVSSPQTGKKRTCFRDFRALVRNRAQKDDRTEERHKYRRVFKSPDDAGPLVERDREADREHRQRGAQDNGAAPDSRQGQDDIEHHQPAGRGLQLGRRPDKANEFVHPQDEQYRFGSDKPG